MSFSVPSKKVFLLQISKNYSCKTKKKVRVAIQDQKPESTQVNKVAYQQQFWS